MEINLTALHLSDYMTEFHKVKMHDKSKIVYKTLS